MYSLHDQRRQRPGSPRPTDAIGGALRRTFRVAEDDFGADLLDRLAQMPADRTRTTCC